MARPENDIRSAFHDFLLRTGIAADESEIVTETRPAADSRRKVDLYLRNGEILRQHTGLKDITESDLFNLVPGNRGTFLFGHRRLAGNCGAGPLHPPQRLVAHKPHRPGDRGRRRKAVDRKLAQLPVLPPLYNPLCVLAPLRQPRPGGPRK